MLPFIKRCKESAKRWNEIIDFLFTFVPPKQAKNVYIEIGKDIQTYKDTSRCQVSKITTRKEALKCFKLRIHRQMIYQSRSVQVETGQDKIATGKPKMSCPNCAASFQCFFKFNMHLREFRKKICRFCSEILDFSAFVEHCKGHNLTVFSCPICLESFEKESALFSHKLKHVKGPEECIDCHETFANAGHLNKHMNIKHKPIVCGCGKKLPNRICFFKHKKICAKHKDMKPKFICDYCKVEYRKKNCLKMHIKLRHTVGWVFQCDFCGKKFSSRAHLIEHRTTHDKITDRYVCYCGAKYSSRRGYERHLKKHSEAKNLRASKRKVKSKATASRTAEMHEESSIPLGACVACASTALAAQEFRLFVRNSDKLWRKALSNLAILPNSAAPPVKSVFAFVKTSDLSIQTFKDFNTNDPKAILNRLRNRVTKKPTERKPRGARTGPSCSCPDCGKSFLSPYYLNTHLRNSGHKEVCLICGLVFVRGKEMQDHLSSIHNETVYLCKKCPILCPNESQLKKHVQKAHKAGALTCTDCGRTFPRNASFESHSQMHAVRTCRACGVQFTNRGCYREHRSQCEPDAKPNAQDMPRNRRSNIRDPATFTCDHCGKTYNSRPQLKNHILWIHMDVRPHQCQWCGKRFYTQARLAEHNVVHTRARNFECDICGAKLVSKMAAVYHRRRHTGERPYECVDCGEKFISASRRSEHAKRRHNKGFRLPCPKCPASFVRRHELTKHLDKAHKAPENALVWPQA